MSNTLPQKFQVKTSQQRQRNKFSLHHNHLTTTDFFKLQPVVCRKVEPNDEMNIDCTSFVRLFPMPFPVFGRIRYYNRCFFVPYRQIMEGFNEFITDTNYNTSDGFVKIQSAPYFTNKDICDAFMASTSDTPLGQDPLIDNIPDAYYWNGKSLVDNTGVMVYWKIGSSQTYVWFTLEDNNQIHVHYGTSTDFDMANSHVQGSMSQSHDSDTGITTLTMFSKWDDDTSFTFSFNDPDYVSTLIRWIDLPGSFDGDTPLSDVPYENVKYDFVFHGSSDVYYRFTNRGRHFYTVLCSLGYRVDFSSAGGSFTETKKLSAGKLLAYLKVYLDWYHPSAYSEDNALRLNFRGVASAGHHITYQHIMEIAYGLDFVTYERDYFTGAWQNPTGPNVSLSPVDFGDPTVVNNTGQSNYNYRSWLKMNSPNQSERGSLNGTPTLSGGNSRNGQSPSQTQYPENLSYYMIEQLRALTNVSRRAQLTGNRAVDRYLAQYGIKLDDDRVNRCYYIGGYHYDADIMDIMSTADTSQAALGDYAGKGIAYSDAHRSFHFESGKEHGFIIVVSSVVPSVGYVQGVDAENLQLSRYQFFTGDFDNLGTQAQQNQELFSDYGMPSPNGTVYPKVLAADGVRGFVPRYIEEKIGRDFLTGDFNIPSRREGMDAFHLFRLVNDPAVPSINKGFLIGEQKQYDRIFNNIDSDYDHMYVEHHVLIDAYRNMKSVNEVYDFEHSDGKEIDVEANGIQLS